MGDKMKSKLLLVSLLLANTTLEAGDINNRTAYSYQYDNDGYTNHQVENNITYKTYGVDYQHNDSTTNYSSFFYDTIMGFKQDTWKTIKYKIGGGGIYGTDWAVVPTYIVDLTKGGWNFNATRTPRASGVATTAGFFGGAYSKQYADSQVLTYEFDPMKDLSIMVGAGNTIFEDNTTAQKIIGKAVYQINDNISLQYQGLFSLSGTNSTLYFNKKQYSYNRVLLSYTRPMLNDSLVFKVLAGPSVVEINNHRNIVPYYDAKLIYRVADSVKVEANHMCVYSTNDYYYCQIGANVNVAF
jgi:hypothetical protein